jgi:hypothetical protein
MSRADVAVTQLQLRIDVYNSASVFVSSRALQTREGRVSQSLLPGG